MSSVKWFTRLSTRLKTCGFSTMFLSKRKEIDFIASVDWKKFHTARDAKAMLRHNDPEKRVETNHSNADIDKSLTSQNVSIFGLSYEDACKRYDDRLEYLDANGNRNKRKDRVTFISLYVPTPEQLPEEQELKWFSDVTKILTDEFGEENIIEGYIHRDEKHEYKDVRTGEMVQSRSHLHLCFVPERDGQLVAKHIMSRTGMRKINSLTDAMTKEKYNVYFLDGTQQRSQGDVESLKSRSRLLEIAEKEEQLRFREEMLDERDRRSMEYSAEIELRGTKIAKKEHELEKRESECRMTEERQRRTAEEQQRCAEQQRAVSEMLHRKERELKEKEDELKKKAERLGLLETAQQRETRVQSMSPTTPTDVNDELLPAKTKGLAYRRRADKIHQKRKLRISNRFVSNPNIRYRGKLVKGKVHCSCPLCANKSTKCVGKSTNSLRYYSASDKRKFEKLNFSYEEYIQTKG